MTQLFHRTHYQERLQLMQAIGGAQRTISGDSESTVFITDLLHTGEMQAELPKLKRAVTRWRSIPGQHRLLLQMLRGFLVVTLQRPPRNFCAEQYWERRGAG